MDFVLKGDKESWCGFESDSSWRSEILQVLLFPSQDFEDWFVSFNNRLIHIYVDRHFKKRCYLRGDCDILLQIT